MPQQGITPQEMFVYSGLIINFLVLIGYFVRQESRMTKIEIYLGILLKKAGINLQKDQGE